MIVMLPLWTFSVFDLVRIEFSISSVKSFQFAFFVVCVCVFV